MPKNLTFFVQFAYFSVSPKNVFAFSSNVWATLVTKNNFWLFYEQLFEKLRETFWKISSNFWKGLTGEPRLHKPSGFFWTLLPTYNSYLHSCIVLITFWLRKNELNWTSWCEWGIRGDNIMCPYYPGVCKRALSQKRKIIMDTFFLWKKKKEQQLKQTEARFTCMSYFECFSVTVSTISCFNPKLRICFVRNEVLRYVNENENRCA